MVGYLLLFAVRRTNRGLPRGPLELLATLRLEQRRALYLVRIAERTVVLGASEGGMVTVLELEPNELGNVTAPTEAATFGDVLRRMLTSPPKRKPHAAEAGKTPNAPPGDA